ncbi:MAG: tetratricopeptide repeat protein [Nocardioides sp.]
MNSTDTANRLEQTILDLWDFRDPVASAERFRSAAEASTDPDEAAVLATQHARATGLAGDLVRAAHLLDGMEASGLAGAALHAGARIAIERGRVLNSTGDPGSAAPHFLQAEELARELGATGLAVDALHMQANVAEPLHGAEAACEINERALAEIEASDDPLVQRWLGPVLNNLGWTTHNAGRPQEALAVFERAVAVRAAALEVQTGDVAGDAYGAWIVARWCVGRTLRTLGSHEEALAVMRELARDPVGADDPFVHEEIAANLKACG